jgi:hypothetical protein
VTLSDVWSSSFPLTLFPFKKTDDDHFQFVPIFVWRFGKKISLTQGYVRR